MKSKREHDQIGGSFGWHDLSGGRGLMACQNVKVTATMIQTCGSFGWYDRADEEDIMVYSNVKIIVATLEVSMD